MCIRKRFCRSKEKSLEMRQKRVRQKEGRQNPCFLSVYSVSKNCAKRRSVGTDQAQISLFSLCYRAFLCLELLCKTNYIGEEQHNFLESKCKSLRAMLVSHHASACICLRLNDIQCFALVIYCNKLRMIYTLSA